MTIQKHHQTVPDDFAELLRRFAVDEQVTPAPGRSWPAARLNSLLATAVAKGWTFTALAGPLGRTSQAIRVRVKRSRPVAGLPPVPMPPMKPTHAANRKKEEAA